MSSTEAGPAAELSTAEEKRKSRKKTAKAAPAAAKGEAFSGRVMLIAAKTGSGGKPVVEIELAGKKAARYAVALDPSDTLNTPVMVALACAALASGQKLHVQQSSPGPAPAARVMELRGKRHR